MPFDREGREAALKNHVFVVSAVNASTSNCRQKNEVDNRRGPTAEIFPAHDLFAAQECDATGRRLKKKKELKGRKETLYR